MGWAAWEEADTTLAADAADAALTDSTDAAEAEADAILALKAVTTGQLFAVGWRV